MSKRWTWILAAVAGVVLVAAGIFIERAWAGGIPMNRPLVYTGLLQNADGSPLSGSGHNIEIRLWNDASAAAGANLLCGTNSQPLTTDAAGRFSLVLSDDCTKGIAANPDTYVEVLLDGAVLGGKRSRLGAVPYAVEASHAVSADSAGVAKNADRTTTADNANGASGALDTRITSVESRLSKLEAASPQGSGFSAHLTSTFSVPNWILTPVVFDAEDFDFGSEYDVATGIFTTKSTGYYAVDCEVGWGSFSASAVYLRVSVLLNGVMVANAGNDGTGHFPSRIVHALLRLAAGDQVTCTAWQDSGSPQTLSLADGAYNNRFSALRVAR